MKYKLISKMLMLIICLFKNRRNFIKEKTSRGFTILFNIEEILTYNSVFDIDLVNHFFFSKIQVIKSGKIN